MTGKSLSVGAAIFTVVLSCASPNDARAGWLSALLELLPKAAHPPIPKPPSVARDVARAVEAAPKPSHETSEIADHMKSHVAKEVTKEGVHAIEHQLHRQCEHESSATGGRDC